MGYKVRGITIIDDNREVVTNNVTATANDRVFVGVNVIPTTPLTPSVFQGNQSGYTSGGAPGQRNTIDKFPFSSDTNATNVGNLTVALSTSAGSSSVTHGYVTGGYVTSPGILTSLIQKFPFSVDTNASNVASLIRPRINHASQSSEVNGYASGGDNPGLTIIQDIEKFSFLTDNGSVFLGALQRRIQWSCGQSSTVSGYRSGGHLGPALGYVNSIEKFPFAAESLVNTTFVGELTQARGYVIGQSSSNHGYTSGGYAPSVNTIDKFTFASDNNATSVGNLSQARGQAAGQSSTTSGYTSGGVFGVNTIDKFPFATDTNASFVGNLTSARGLSAGNQARTLQ